MKLFARSTISGATLAGAVQKTANLGFWDALKTAGISPNTRSAVTASGTLTTDQCGLVPVDATAGSIVLVLPVSGSDTDDAVYQFRRIDGTANTVTIRRNGTDTIEGASNDLFLPAAGAVLELQMPAGATNWRVVTLTGGTQAGARSLLGFPLRGFIAGLTLSTAGASASFGVAAGEAADSANAVLLQLAAAVTKTTGAWAVGSGTGGLDTGAIAASTWYHAHLIRRPDTGVVDVLVSLSASAPTMPANYTQSRRIGSMKTNGSSQWTKFIQDGDYFVWDAAVTDVNAANPGTAAVSRTISVPTGINVRAQLRCAVQVLSVSTAVNSALLVSDLAITDAAPTFGSSGVTAVAGRQAADNYGAVETIVRTNTSAQVRSRLSASDASVSLFMSTAGWYDTRGRDA